ncbi:tRNA-dependent cyclodipeptide synthase [Streptomyces sp. NRRL F-5123]|uniref:tRNA-dependent cyclodipeptide synthase n=1 Tax=Streptomyces sp. NRRL F-5123 TaxID=1463856 RepID=UPI00069383AE|nr:tRNA-dependent cyclodipeptide synthase [Streptomyces sp. NRRL F-5123]
MTSRTETSVPIPESSEPPEPSFGVEPLTGNCRRVFDRGEHALIGVSPGNSYFSEELLTGLLRWTALRFDRIDVVIPDSARRETFLALGYAPERARKKSWEEASRIRNRVLRAWEAAGVTSRPFAAHRLSRLTEHPAYQALLHRTEQEWAKGSVLRESYLAAARSVLHGLLKGAAPTQEQAELAARHLIAETPLLIGAPDVFGVASSAAFYHKRIDFIDAVYAGHTSLDAHPDQGFVIVQREPAEAPAPAPASVQAVAGPRLLP